MRTYCLPHRFATMPIRTLRDLEAVGDQSILLMGTHMSSKRSSIMGDIGRWLSAEILVFATALLLMSLFAFLSFANAFLGAIMLVIVVVLYKTMRKKSAS